MKGINLLFLLAACASPISKTGDPIKDGIAKGQKQFTQCFLESDSYKGKSHVEKGTVTTAFTIDPEGKVRAERIVDTSFKDPNLHACLLSVIDKLQFEKPKDGVATEVTQPISFFPKLEE
jgi:TonB family protein